VSRPRTTPSTPDFTLVTQREEEYLAARLEAVRALITHPGEKGHALEAQVTSFLRGLLPAEYGLSTGFVAYEHNGDVKLSPQLDVIIYDAVSSGPLARLEALDVFPLEAVYGYVEVKATLRSITGCLRQNRLVREMTCRRYWAPVPHSRIKSELVTGHDVPIRGFVFAFGVEGDQAISPVRLARSMSDASRRLGSFTSSSGVLTTRTHLHGVLVAGKVLLRTRAAEPGSAQLQDLYQVDYVEQHALAHFKSSLLLSLARFPRAPERSTPALDRYYRRPAWRTIAPSGAKPSRRRPTKGS
jgi:hypothetical protein